MKTKKDTRYPYMWHLRLPFNKPKSPLFFDRKIWWKNSDDVEPEAAIYELARRHPLVGKRITTPWLLTDTKPAIICLGDIGRKSWPNLTPAQKFMWRSFAGHLKGVDCRTDEEQCSSLNEVALLEIQMQRGKENQPRLVAKQIKKNICVTAENEPTADEWDKGIAASAIAAFSKRQLLIAVAPDLPEERAEKLMMQKYREHRDAIAKLSGTGKQRARPDNWLALIEMFEKAATSKNGIYSQNFNAYKRTIDSISFS
jgi:hypothetical protein